MGTGVQVDPMEVKLESQGFSFSAACQNKKMDWYDWYQIFHKGELALCIVLLVS